MLELSRRQLAEIFHHANGFKIMGENRCRSLTVDYVPARSTLIIPRLDGDDALSAHPPHVEQIDFHLEDQMFAGEIFASITCRGCAIIVPFRWTSYETLAKMVVGL